MISVIVCSSDPNGRLRATETMYRQALAPADVEFVGISNPTSLAMAYNNAIAASHGEILIFSHDDVEVLSPNLAGVLEDSLRGESDLLGVARTSRLIDPRWDCAGHPYIFGQIANPLAGPDQLIEISMFNVARRCIRNIQAIDGVFMACTRALAASNPFDQSRFDGFHLYDLDFSFSAFQKGARLCIRNDIQLLHTAAGDFFSPSWPQYAQAFREKWAGKLPQQWQGPLQCAGALARGRDEARTLMTPAYWDQG